MKYNNNIIIFVFCIFLLQPVYGQVQNTLIRIQGGSFIIGSPDDERGRNLTDEGPQHRVTVSSFYVSKFPVTQGEFEEVMRTNPTQIRREANLPADSISWFDAVEYCNRRSTAEGLTPVYTINGSNVTWNRQANGYRLLTEAEWEYACRAGTTTPFYSGNSMDDAGWYQGNTYSTTSTGARYRSTFPVGLKQPNAWGLYDMHGNVLEWCWDWFALYTSEPKVDPIGPAAGQRRVYRGGAWDLVDTSCRSAYRFGGFPAMRMHWIGFRVGRNA